jgi:hypothetical protein
MTPEKTLELIKKVKALVDKGVGGESSSAKEKLKILCEKYNISESQLGDIDEKRDFYFILKDNHERELLKNITCMVLDVPAFKWRENNLCVKISLTNSQHRDIDDAFDYYKKMYDDYKMYLIQGILVRNAVGYTPKPQTYTQENVVQPDIPPTPPESKSEDVSEDNKGENSEGNNDKESKDNKKSEDVSEEKPIDPIKLMKIAVALEQKPWKKIDPNKKLIDEESNDTV